MGQPVLTTLRGERTRATLYDYALELQMKILKISYSSM